MRSNTRKNVSTRKQGNTIEDRVCPILQKATLTQDPGFAPPPWKLAQCAETGMVFLKNPPSYEALKVDLAWEVTSKAESASRQAARPAAYRVSSWVKQFRGRVLKRNKMGTLICDELRHAPTEGAIQLLDVGCGWGGLLDSALHPTPKALRERCVPNGIEISRELAGIAHERMSSRGGRCVHADAISGMADLPANSLDVIVMSSFLEHEVQPLALLRACSGRLRKPAHAGRKGGCIVLKVPNYDSLNRHMRGASWCGFRWPDHVNYFTPATLTLMAETAGLFVSRMTWLDRHPFSDSMYAVLRAR